MVQKIPPPPRIANQDNAFNRWLIELTNILNGAGVIDPTTIAGLIALTAQVNTNTTNIATDEANITTINTEITTINGEITTLNSEVAALQANAVVRNGSGTPAAGLGNNGDLYINNTGGAGTRLFGKIAGAWVAIA